MGMTTDKRQIWMDAIRIFASFAVMIIHISSQYLAEVEAGSHTWIVFRIYRDTCSFAVPIFVMISGTLFLSREIPIRVILKKYVTRIAILFAFWSALYAVVFLHQDGILTMIGSFVKGYSHMWFLYMIVGLYLVTPVIRKFTSEDDLRKLFLVLGLFFYTIGKDMISIISIINGKAGGYLQSAFQSMGVTLCTGFIFYYVLGYHLCKTELQKRWSTLLFVSGGVAFLAPIITFFLRLQFGTRYLGDILYDFETIRMLKTIFVFLLFRQVFSRINVSQKGAAVTEEMGRLSLGAYLIHQLIITLLNRWCGINTLSTDAVFSVPLIGLMVFILSYSIIWLVRKIPIFKKSLT